jgi:hypothetical protein
LVNPTLKAQVSNGGWERFYRFITDAKGEMGNWRETGIYRLLEIIS